MIKKKTIILSVIAIVVIGILSFLIMGILKGSNKKSAITKELESIPAFQFNKLDGTVFTQDDVKKDCAAIFISFHSDCDFCINETESITQHIAEFGNTQFFFISPEPISVIRSFAEEKGLINQPNITFLHDKKLIFPLRFDVNTSPYTLVYDKQGKLIKRFSGQILAPAILKALNDDEKK